MYKTIHIHWFSNQAFVACLLVIKSIEKYWVATLMKSCLPSLNSIASQATWTLTHRMLACNSVRTNKLSFKKRETINLHSEFNHVMLVIEQNKLHELFN